MTHIIVPLADGFEEIEAVTVIDILRRAGCTVTTAGLKKKDVAGAHDIPIQADTTLRQLPPSYDGFVLPGGMPGTDNLMRSPQVLSFVQETFNKGLLCAAICAAPIVLGKAGILEGRRATCYPGYEDQLTGARYIEAAVVRDRNIVTSRGVGTALAFALELVILLCGETAAANCSKKIIYS
jgi:protein deglycase